MKEFYASEGILEMRLVESFQMTKAMSEGADYENTFDPASAESLVEQAEEFVRVAGEVVSKE
jgi:uncharacterized protein (UPF0332 family)